MEGIESPLYKSSEVKLLQGFGAPTSLGNNWRKQDCFSINCWDQIILQIGEQEDSPQLINPPKSAVGDLLGPLFLKSFGHSL